MVSLACTTSREDDVTLVTARIENPDRPRRVRVENQLDGPVWPPRREGVPAAGWTDDGFECLLAADETRAVGYASPAPPADPPLLVVETEPVDPDAIEESADTGTALPSVESSPTAVIRELGSPCPPRDAVPVPNGDSETTATAPHSVATATTDEESDAVCASPQESGPPNQSEGADAHVETGATAAQSVSQSAEPESAPEGSQRPAPGPETVETWLADVETRLELAEQLSGTTRLSTVADVLERAGGLDGLRDAATQLDADAETLREVAKRTSALADRAETATVPVEHIERLQ
ncbi:MAG: hypothetical protein ABEI77_10065 [Halorientalis sp.]